MSKKSKLLVLAVLSIGIWDLGFEFVSKLEIRAWNFEENLSVTIK